MAKIPDERASFCIDDVPAGWFEQHTHLFSFVGVSDREDSLLAEGGDEVVHISSHVVHGHIGQIDFAGLVGPIVLDVLVDQFTFVRQVGGIILDDFRPLEDQATVGTSVDALDPVGSLIEVLLPGQIEYHRSIKHVRGS